VHTKELHRAPKTVTKAGQWKSGGKNMPKSAFPLGKGRAYQLGAAWMWRVDQLEALGQECRLLSAFNAKKQGYMAMLTIKQDQDFVVVASYEFHGDHPGWHVHACCSDIDKIDVGLARPRDGKRFPGTRSKHRNDKYVDVTETDALNIAFKFFNVVGPAKEESAQGSLL
jgi:hypothetical protein